MRQTLTVRTLCGQYAPLTIAGSFALGVDLGHRKAMKRQSERI
jgi:hypothetical protein